MINNRKKRWSDDCGLVGNWNINKRIKGENFMKAKKLIALVLSVLLIMATLPTFALFSVSATEPVVKTVYVSSSGNDSTGDGTSANPYATIAKAEAVIEAYSADKGEVIMLTDMNFTSAAHTKMITIKGDTGAENLVQTGSITSANGPTTFKDFSINDTFKNITDGNEVVYENIAVSGTKGMFYFGNSDSNITTPNNITINGLGSGVNNGVNVRFGPGTRQGIVNSDINLVINRGYFYQFWVHEGTYNGNVSVTFNGGVVYSSDPFMDPYTNYTTTYNGAYQLIFNNGFSQPVSPSVNSITAGGGKWLMYGDSTGGMLSTTATPGTFAVSEGYIATATNRSTNAEYESAAGTLTVPAGTYDVTYEAAPSDADTFYVSSSGSNANNGLTSATPFATIAQAETALEASSALSGDIIMLTDMTFTSAAHTKMMTIKGATGAENLTNTGSVVSVNGPTTFKDFNINNTFNHVTNGNEVVYDNITFTNTRGNFFFGNLNTDITTSNKITLNGVGQSINNGPNVRIGPHQSGSASGQQTATNGTINSDIDIVVNSGYYNQLYMLNGTYNGNVNFTINGGRIYGNYKLDFLGNNLSTFNGAYQVILNNGLSKSSFLESAAETITATGGKWLMYCDNSGGALSTTSTPGTFNITGTSSAIATNTSTGVSYSSSTGTLTVPAGEYTVSFGYAINNTSTFYVSEDGDDSNNGLSAATAFETINQAQRWFNYSTAATKTIIVSGEVAFDGGEPHSDMITIRGDGTASLTYDTTGQYNSQIYGNIALKGPTTFENITVDDTKMVSNGYELILGDNVQAGAGETNDGYYYVGNLDNSTSSTKSENVTINSFNSDYWHGAFVRIGAFGDAEGRAMGDVNITINGGYFKQIQFWQAEINGNVNFIINGGSVNTVEGSEYSTSVHDNTSFNGAVQFIMNKSMDDRFLGSAFAEGEISAADGVWYVYCTDTAGGQLAATDVAGNYAISGANYARAVNRSTGEIIYSYEGELDLSGEDGTYDVTLYDSVHFGDVNLDGVINVVDLVMEKKIIAEQKNGEVDYVWAADIDEDLEMAASDITALVNHLLGRETIVWQASSAISLISAAAPTFGGAESAATSMKSTINNVSDTVKNQSGTKYYISPTGNDSNAGTSSGAPLKTIAGLNAKNIGTGSIVLFERGGVYRTSAPLDLKTNVKVGAYGTGAKPVISGSVKNYAENTVWTSGDGSVWQTDIGAEDIGGVVFNDGASIGNRKSDIKSLLTNGDYYYDLEDGILYLFLDQNKPSAYFDSIEISTTEHLIYENKNTAVSNVTIQNIEFAHSALTMVDLHKCSNITITGCKFSFGGGAMDNEGVRYGNGIQFWNAIDTASVTNCYFYQIYDAAFTIQGHSNTNNYRNVTFSNNLVECTSYNIEIWCYNLDGSNDGYQATAVIDDVIFSNNLFRYSGYGFGKQRSATYSQAYLLCYGFEPDNILTFDVTFSNNTFDCARSYYFNASEAYDDFTFSGNTYYQSSDCVYPIVRDDLDTSDDVIPTNLSQFTTEIHTVDPTATVNWITLP